MSRQSIKYPWKCVEYVLGTYVGMQRMCSSTSYLDLRPIILISVKVSSPFYFMTRHFDSTATSVWNPILRNWNIVKHIKLNWLFSRTKIICTNLLYYSISAAGQVGPPSRNREKIRMKTNNKRVSKEKLFSFANCCVVNYFDIDTGAVT